MATSYICKLNGLMQLTLYQIMRTEKINHHPDGDIVVIGINMKNGHISAVVNSSSECYEVHAELRPSSKFG